MFSSHICKNCNEENKLWIPPNPQSTIVNCPYCKHEEDVFYMHKQRTLEELEILEYERLKRKYG